MVGTVSEEGFLVRLALFGMPLDEVLIEDVINRSCPGWRPSGRSRRRRGEVSFALRSFTFLRATKGWIERPDARGSAALEIRLPESLLRDLRIEHDQRWVQWEPVGIDVVFDRTNRTYQAAELPLGGGRSVALSGTSRDGRYNLGGVVAPTVLRNLGGQSVDEDARVRIEISNQSDLERPRVLVSPAEFVTAIER